MGDRLKKVAIDELEIGMFIVEIDISWIRSPFLVHKKAVKTRNDIIILKKSGVKEVTIDLEKSHIKNTRKNLQQAQGEIFDEQLTPANSKAQAQRLPDSISDADKLDQFSVPLNEEMKQAKALKKQANLSFDEINEAIKSNQNLPVKKLSPIIDDTVSSLLRNSQALLSLMNLKQYEERLFSHSFNVMILALIIAIKDGLKKEEFRVLGQAALLHDIGWTQLPHNLFGKAKPYTENELKVVHQHIKLSKHILSQSNDVDEESKELIMLHHERSDGSGYPYSKTKREIKPLARILIVADYYDAMLHGLLGSPGLIAAEALRALYKESLQNKLERYYVEILIKFLGIYPLWSPVELTSGEKAIVIGVIREKPLAPDVKIVYSSDGQPLATPMEIELQNDKKNRKIKTLINHVDKNIDPMNILVMTTT